MIYSNRMIHFEPWDCVGQSICANCEIERLPLVVSFRDLFRIKRQFIMMVLVKLLTPWDFRINCWLCRVWELICAILNFPHFVEKQNRLDTRCLNQKGRRHKVYVCARLTGAVGNQFTYLFCESQQSHASARQQCVLVCSASSSHFSFFNTLRHSSHEATVSATPILSPLSSGFWTTTQRPWLKRADTFQA